MEESGILCSDDDFDIFALHYVYMPRIQHALNEFRGQWNFHGLSSMGHVSPLQLWAQGLITNSMTSQPRDTFDLGIDYEGPVPQLQTENHIVVPDITANLTMAQIEQLSRICMEPLEDDGNHGINYFCDIKRYLETL
jgi:hypothetical protein